MPPTMKDVAALADVSVKTVSRVVNGHPNISAELRTRVSSAIEELQWQPNTHARSLRTGRTGLIALSLDDLRSPRLAQFAEALVLEATRHDLQISLEPSRGRPERVGRTLSALGSTFDGAIHLGPLPDDVLEDLDPTLPVVALLTGGDAESPPPRVATLDVDETAAARLLGQHLRTLGADDITILGLPATTPDAFTAALEREFPRSTVLRPERRADRASGQALTEVLIAEGRTPGALVCADDELAIGALSALRQHGVAIPSRTLLTGHGNLPDGRFTTPSLTTIDIDIAEIARHALDLLRARRDDASRPPARTLLPVNLLRGESTLGLGSAR
ncbi:LacI family DNA-binding transcriptional regulator [Brachybacterium sp. J144]|uniref:LacI family DNA-binding transcriptional regulator n=1 Tax=Brachybacterium sp. J144 TaxID=3116487 RepID=UPI002E766CC3|nr:LacI family DNA-binding transcriptional regulator [Brachybacterium sp. J144]MEE1649906.1 LacI family DNA-binding transcriptional regulator [Brachybacterium sp. J144]